MKRLRARAAACLVCAFVLGLPSAARPAASDLVIVVDESSPIRSISVADVRRRFLGIPLAVDGVEVIPVRNLSNTDFYEVFLQRVLFMSAQSYERRMLNKIFRDGGDRILAVTSIVELSRALHDDPRRISFAPRGAVGSNLRIVAEP
jgi:hypothetical protein